MRNRTRITVLGVVALLLSTLFTAGPAVLAHNETVQEKAPAVAALADSQVSDAAAAANVCNSKYSTTNVTVRAQNWTNGYGYYVLKPGQCKTDWLLGEIKNLYIPEGYKARRMHHCWDGLAISFPTGWHSGVYTVTRGNC